LVPISYKIIKSKLSGLKAQEGEQGKGLKSLVEGTNPEKPWALQMATLFLLRRVYYTLLFAWPQSLHLVQLSLNLIHCVAQLAYLFKI